MPTPPRRLTPERITALHAAWTDYKTVHRQVWTCAPFIERRFYRTQDAPAYAAEQAHTLSRINAAIRGLGAAARRICGRDAQVAPLGATRAGMPTCFLVRVPNGRTLMPEELVLGAPHRDDQAGLAAIARREHADLTARARMAAEDRQQAHYDKMVSALTEARTHLAMKARIRGELQLEHGRVYGDPAPEVQAQRQRAYFHHGRYVRCWARAVVYKNKLAHLGLAYDLASISTTVVLPEGGANEPQGDLKAA